MTCIAVVDVGGWDGGVAHTLLARLLGGGVVAESMFGPYRLDGLIGRGGMGEVHRAFDTSQKRDVALKLLPAQLSADVEFRTRFQREAEITATLREPHVIPIHRYGEIEGRLFLDMRLVDGEDLATLLERESHLGPARAVAIVEQVAAALDAAHGDGLIHRDVKPSNVLVSSTRRGGPDFVYLVDFGIARFAAGTGMTGTGAIIGTLPYMAPERFLDGQIDHRSDVYSLACLLFELLSGRRPFPGADFALINAHLHEAPPALSSVRAGLPSALDGVIRRGLAKSPAARHSSAGEFAAHAARATSGHPPASPTVAPRGKGRRGPRPGTAPPVVSGIDGVTRGRAAAATRAPRFREPVLTGHDGGVHAVATATVAGNEVVVSAGEDRTVRVWDVLTGRPVGSPLLGHTDAVVALATTQIRGRPVAVSGSWDETVRVWDLLTSSPAGPPLAGHGDAVYAVAASGSIVVSAGADKTVRVWDLLDQRSSGRSVGSWMNRHSAWVQALACGHFGGLLVAASVGDDGTHRIWDLGDRRLISGPYRLHDGPVLAVAITDIGGQLLGVSAGADRSLNVWELATGRLFGQRLVGHADVVQAVATTDLGGSPVAVSGGSDGTVRVWDLLSTTAAGGPFAGHRDWVQAIAVTRLGGSPIAISGSADATIRLWDLEAMLG